MPIQQVIWSTVLHFVVADLGSPQAELQWGPASSPRVSAGLVPVDKGGHLVGQELRRELRRGRVSMTRPCKIALSPPA